jgi:indole-3-acetate monooxygenase
MRRTLDEVTELARTKNPVASSGLLKERASAQLQLGERKRSCAQGACCHLPTA